MNRISLAALLFALSACVMFPMGGPMNGTCIQNEIQNFVGQHESGLFATKALMTVRVITPGMAVTEDYNAARANFEVDANGKIIRAYCG